MPKSFIKRPLEGCHHHLEPTEAERTHHPAGDVEQEQRKPEEEQERDRQDPVTHS
jgi:hypothetical protein